MSIAESILLQRREKRWSASESAIIASADCLLAKIIQELRSLNQEIEDTKKEIVSLKSRISNAKTFQEQRLRSHLLSFKSCAEELKGNLLLAEAKEKELTYPPCSKEQKLASSDYQKLVAHLEESYKKASTPFEEGEGFESLTSKKVTLIKNTASAVAALLDRVQKRELFVTEIKTEILAADAKAEELNKASHEISLAVHAFQSTKIKRPVFIKGLKSWLEDKIGQMRHKCIIAEQRAVEMEEALKVYEHPTATWFNGHLMTVEEFKKRTEEYIESCKREGNHVAAHFLSYAAQEVYGNIQSRPRLLLKPFSDYGQML